MKKNQKGFSLLELLTVIGIMTLIGSLMYASFNAVRAKERDRKRLTDIRLVELALEEYWNKFGNYPASDGQGIGGWDTPGNGTFLGPLVQNKFLANNIFDPTENDDFGNYRYFRFSPGDWPGCNPSNGSYYVLGIADLETVSSEVVSSDSPGFKCENYDFQNDFEWVTGKFQY